MCRDYSIAASRVLENIKLTENIENQVKAKAAGFFLPDFCGARAVFILVLVTELFVLATVLAASGIRTFSWDYLALVSLFVQWIVLVSAMLLCGLRKYLANLALSRAVLIIYGLILMVTALASIAAGWIMSSVGLIAADRTFDGAALVRNLIISAIMTGMVLRYLYLQAQLRLKEQIELQSRIQALQSRIRPHFLFNSMNIIASLIDVDPKTAERVVEDLSELFRASLKKADAPVNLGQELELCKRYVGIEQLRLGDRLKVNWQIDSVPQGATIPLLTLQPLLENAIYHGVQPLPEGGVIEVLVGSRGKRLEITIRNPYDATKPSANGDSNHVALDNIRSRIYAFYGSGASLDTHVGDGVFITQLSYSFGEEKAHA